MMSTYANWVILPVDKRAGWWGIFQRTSEDLAKIFRDNVFKPKSIAQWILLWLLCGGRTGSTTEVPCTPWHTYAGWGWSNCSAIGQDNPPETHIIFIVDVVSERWVYVPGTSFRRVIHPLQSQEQSGRGRAQSAAQQATAAESRGGNCSAELWPVLSGLFSYRTPEKHRSNKQT